MNIRMTLIEERKDRWDIDGIKTVTWLSIRFRLKKALRTLRARLESLTAQAQNLAESIDRSISPSLKKIETFCGGDDYDRGQTNTKAKRANKRAERAYSSSL
jgi:hypothetical protein